MLNLRCPDKATCWCRIVYAGMLCLAVHCVVAYAQGARGGEMFDVGNWPRTVSLLSAVGVVGLVAAVSWPKSSLVKPSAPVQKEADSVSPQIEPPAPEPPAPEPPAPELLPPEPVVAPISSVALESPVSEPPAVPAPIVTTPVEEPALEKTTVREKLVRQKPAERRVGAGLPKPVGSQRYSTPSAMAEQMWKTARTIGHNYVPTARTDRRYLSLVHEAAMAGCEEAQSKLAEYAMRRGTMVEAYYWLKRLQLNGGTGLDGRLRECRTKWMTKGCASERSNVHAFFTERQSALGRAVLRLDAGVLINKALARLKDMAAEGDPLAAQVLDLRDGRRKARVS